MEAEWVGPPYEKFLTVITALPDSGWRTTRKSCKDRIHESFVYFLSAASLQGYTRLPSSIVESRLSSSSSSDETRLVLSKSLSNNCSSTASEETKLAINLIKQRTNTSG